LEPPNCEKATCGEAGVCDVTDHPKTGFPTILCTCFNGTEFYEAVDCGPLSLKMKIKAKKTNLENYLTLILVNLNQQQSWNLQRKI
jgi:hypothetical protein